MLTTDMVVFPVANANALKAEEKDRPVQLIEGLPAEERSVRSN